MNQQLKAHVDAIFAILKDTSVRTSAVTRFESWMLTFVDGALQLERNADRLVETHRTFVGVLDGARRLTEDLELDLTADKFADLKRHYLEVQFLLFEHQRNVLKKVAGLG